MRRKGATVNQLWDRIEVWLAVNARAVAASLNQPASSKELDRTQRCLGVQLPEDFRATYLRHNGADGPDLFEGWKWLSLAEIRRQWKGWKEVLDSGAFAGKKSGADGKIVRTDWWSTGWIPFTGEESDHLCVDLAPGPKGRIGQIIEMWHDWEHRPMVAASLQNMLSEFADDLEGGKMVVLPEGDVFRRRDG